MSTTSDPSDALVFFGATGDLAHKKVFPALQNMIQHGHLDVPVVGVAKSGWTLDQLQAQARDSLAKHGGVDEAAFAKLVKVLKYVDGDYNDPETFVQIRKAWARRSGPCTTWRSRRASSPSCRSICTTPGVPRTPESWSRNRSGAT